VQQQKQAILEDSARTRGIRMCSHQRKPYWRTAPGLEEYACAATKGSHTLRLQKPLIRELDSKSNIQGIKTEVKTSDQGL
jgi:hypothetical protein